MLTHCGDNTRFGSYIPAKQKAGNATDAVFLIMTLLIAELQPAI